METVLLRKSKAPDGSRRSRTAPLLFLGNLKTPRNRGEGARRLYSAGLTKEKNRRS